MCGTKMVNIKSGGPKMINAVGKENVLSRSVVKLINGKSPITGKTHKHLVDMFLGGLESWTTCLILLDAKVQLYLIMVSYVFYYTGIQPTI